jgi:transcriptional regulator with XRE-family HTH domain
MTLEDVGSQLGVHRSTVLRYERGDTARISLPVIEQLAGILKTTPAWLMGWESDDEVFDPDIKLIARRMQALPADKRDMLIRIIGTMSDIADEELKKK